MLLSAPVYQLKRRARLLARSARLSLHEALDRLAREEGFRNWSHLAAAMSARGPAADVLGRLRPGDLMLLGARPGHGKTLFGLEIAVATARKGRRAWFFTLEYTPLDVLERLRSLGIEPNAIGGSFVVDASDDICADYIISRMDGGGREAVAVIDYLQLLDQKRRHADIATQIRRLKTFARESGSIVVVLSQIDRAFELRTKRLPDLSDVRLPNPLDLRLFTKICFLHEGRVRFDAAA